MSTLLISEQTQLARVPSLHLLYHELRQRSDGYTYAIENSVFKQHVDFLADNNALGASTVPVELTFDDGHSSLFEVALPILSARALKAHFFVTAGWTGTKPGYMGWKELRCLMDDGHAIGAHGWSHTLLTDCSPRELEAELRHPKLLLEDKLGVQITTISMPGGRYNARVLEACRQAGYSKVYTSVPRIADSDTEFMIGRVNINSRMTLEWLARLLQPSSRELRKLQRQYRLKTSAKLILGNWLYEKLWTIVTHKDLEA